MALITYPNNPGGILNGTLADATDVMANFTAITDEVNGNLDDTNIAAGGVGNSSIADGSVDDPKIVDVDGGKVLPGTLPLSALGFPLAGGPGNVEVGAGFLWFADYEPALYKLCNGQHLDKTTYALLYAVIGDRFSTPAWQLANPTDFKLPDLRQRVPVGMGDDPLAVPGYGFTNDLGLNEGVDQDAQSTGWPGHQHDWDLPTHTHSLPNHHHTTFSGAGTLPVAASNPAPGSTATVAPGTTKWRISNGAGFDTSTPTVSAVTGGPTPDITGPASAGAAHTHNLSAHTHGLGGHRHDVNVVTGTIGGAAITGPNPDTPDTNHTHNFAIGAVSVTGTASYNSATEDTGSVPAGVGVSTMGAVATQQTDVAIVPFLTVNFLIYAGA